MNHPGHDADVELRQRLKVAFPATPPAHLTARVAERARPPMPQTSRRRDEYVAPAAGLLLLLGFLVGAWPLLRASMAVGSGGGTLPAFVGLALTSLAVPLSLGALIELSRGAPLLRRLVR